MYAANERKGKLGMQIWTHRVWELSTVLKQMSINWT